jgi:hypothetical protein
LEKKEAERKIRNWERKGAEIKIRNLERKRAGRIIKIRKGSGEKG